MLALTTESIQVNKVIDTKLKVELLPSKGEDTVIEPSLDGSKGLNAEGVNPSKKVFASILDTIGNTPLIKVNRLTKMYGIECNLYVKCEFFNGGGSIKDRIAKNMIESLEKQGKLDANSTIIEATSGNTGIGVSLVSLVKGYKSIIAMPERMAREKVDLLLAMGSDVLRTPNEAANDSEDCHLNQCFELSKSIENSVVLNQLSNPDNPEAHFSGTAEELLDQLDHNIDMLVAGVGTGGTITGIAKKLKQTLGHDKIKVVGVDIQGSTLALPASLNTFKGPFKIEGIGLDIVPDVLNRELIDSWVKVSDQESFDMARQLIQLEGLLCGGSCGSAMFGALQAAKSLKKGQNCVVILPDSIRSYMSTLVKKDWLLSNDLIATKTPVNFGLQFPEHVTIGHLNLKPSTSIFDTLSCRQALEVLEQDNLESLPILESNTNQILGSVTKSGLLVKCLDGRASLDDPITKVMYKYNMKTSIDFNNDTKLSQIVHLFEDYAFLMVKLQTEGTYIKVTKSDLLTYLVKNKV